MVYIYILELEENKYYVGKTDNPDIRFQDHFNSNGSAWTKKYKPIKLLELIPNCTDYHEDMYTKMYMDKYGIDNVRGGSFVTISLDESTIKYLKLSSTSTNNRCFSCDKTGHFVKDCPNNLKSLNNPINKFKNRCERCGRGNHKKETCFAKRYINGDYIKDNDCLRCGRRCITELCKETYDIRGDIIKNNNSRQITTNNMQCTYCNSNRHKDFNCPYFQQEQAEFARDHNICSRCLKMGHYRFDCYETKDLNNNIIEDTCIIS